MRSAQIPSGGRGDQQGEATFNHRRERLQIRWILEGRSTASSLMWTPSGRRGNITTITGILTLSASPLKMAGLTLGDLQRTHSGTFPPLPLFPSSRPAAPLHSVIDASLVFKLFLHFWERGSRLRFPLEIRVSGSGTGPQTHR